MRTILHPLFSLAEFSPEKLALFAQNSNGYAGDDGACSLTYPGDLDELEKLQDGREIPRGMVRVSCYGYQDELITEAEYLLALQEFLEIQKS